MNKDKIIAKQKELIKVLDDQIKLVTNCLEDFDFESYGYNALAISQKITTLESDLQALESETEPDKELYEKVYIKSKSDLPKERTILIAHFKHSDRWTDLIYFDTEEDMVYWMSEVDYYLKPLK